MIYFFFSYDCVYAVESSTTLDTSIINQLEWLFSNGKYCTEKALKGRYIGPRREMITPWSTNAVEITQNMGIKGINRIEQFVKTDDENPQYDPMLQRLYDGLDQDIFTVNKQPDPIIYIDDLKEYNKKEGLALSDIEIEYLEGLEKKLGRKLTDSEVFGFSQVNSEHCRHKIFGGTFIIDGQEKKESLFSLIKKTSQVNPNYLVSAYKDNVAFLTGGKALQFAPQRGDEPSYFEAKEIETVLSLKAETHNFPTTVEPFNGAATGSGGEIRDRLAGGTGSLPLAGTAVYMTAYSRHGRATDRAINDWEKRMEERKWLYQTPAEILIKASNGASDFGNKFGQPIICGSLLTFEHEEGDRKYAFDKVIMMAGGVGFAKKSDALKKTPEKNQKVVVLGGDNYRIGMGGGAVSSVDTGKYGNEIELNAVQRSNPEMQKRVSNAIRAMVESAENPIISIHDHGAGGHLNCLSELVEETGGEIDMDKLPVGDPTLSAREIVGNESQERMGLVINEKDVENLQKIASRERSPMYVVGRTTGDMNFCFRQKDGQTPINWQLSDMFGNAPKTIMRDQTVERKYNVVKYNKEFNKCDIYKYAESVLRLESVGCKDWLTNKVDRSVTGKVAKQQCCGELQLPLNNLGAVAIDYTGVSGIATSIGHAPAVGLIDAEAGSKISVARALTNIVFAPLQNDLKGVSLSANWMWPCRQKGEDARLYKAVEAMSDFVCELGINIPTGKDSLSMTQKYPDGSEVLSPGTVIISAMSQVSDIRKIIEPVLVCDQETSLIYIDFSGVEKNLGGSAFAQINSSLGECCPTINNTEEFVRTFQCVQKLIHDNLVLSGHDISAGGLLTTLLEMNFANSGYGITAELSGISTDVVKALFSENPGVILQIRDISRAEKIIAKYGVKMMYIGHPQKKRKLDISFDGEILSFDIDKMRDIWYETSAQLDAKQSGEGKAKERLMNYKNQPLKIDIKKSFYGKMEDYGISLVHKKNKKYPKAAIIREKGVNGDREMAYSLYLAGFDVKDVHMTDLIEGREDLSEVNMIVFCGGFSNSDVLGSAKGWAGAFLYNEKAKTALENFYKREDTLSLGVCNGCQLMVELGLIYPLHEKKPRMLHNDSRKFESNFISVEVQKNNSVLLSSLSGSKLGVWVAHGEGKFDLPYDEQHYNIVLKYAYDSYPANPNGSKYSTAGICSADGRHLAMMPHPERAIFPWQCACYPKERRFDEITPWVEMFVNGRKWVENNSK